MSKEIRGIAYWACINKPNTKFTPVYSIDLAVTEEERDNIIRACEEVGGKGCKVPTFKKVDDLFIVKIKRDVARPDNTPNEKPGLYDAKGKPFSKNVGNGSEVIVCVNPYIWKNRFGEGASLDLMWVQVLTLVPYDDNTPRPKVQEGYDSSLDDENI